MDKHDPIELEDNWFSPSVKYTSVTHVDSEYINFLDQNNKVNNNSDTLFSTPLAASFTDIIDNEDFHVTSICKNISFNDLTALSFENSNSICTSLTHVYFKR